jgi:hypothetical protein
MSTQKKQIGRISSTRSGSKPSSTKSLPVVSTWRGKKLNEYSKSELIDIVIELGQALEQESYEHSRQLDVLQELIP